MTFDEANDQILGVLNECWKKTNHEIFFDGVPKDRFNNRSPFLRVTVRHQTGGQRTLGGKGNRQFGRTGFVMAQIYFPFENGWSEGYQLAMVISDAIEGSDTPDGVWFRRLRINEAGRDGLFNILNVVFDFDYQEIK